MSYGNNFIVEKNKELLKQQFQPDFPLVYDSLFGPYRAITDLKQSIQKDFEYLLLTNPGEWPMNPDLGIGIRKYLFENYGSPQLGKIQERIKIQLDRYLPYPYVELISAQFAATPEDQDQGFATLRIRYSILNGEPEEALGTIDGIVFSATANSNITTPLYNGRISEKQRADVAKTGHLFGLVSEQRNI